MKPRRLRVKVALRPKQRSRRNQFAAVFSIVVVIGAAAAATVKHLVRDLGSFSIEVVGVPDPLRREAAAFLASRGRLSPAAQAKVLKDQFPCLKSVAVRRDWLKRAARLELSMRSAIAPATINGKDAGFLSEDNVLFAAPRGLYEAAAPLVEAAGAGPDDLKTAVILVRVAARPGALPAGLQALRFVSAQDGWEARLSDGTTVLWGDGRWTAEKLERLKEALSDARLQSGPAARFTADLRYFEDGKVLLRPVPAHVFSMR